MDNSSWFEWTRLVGWARKFGWGKLQKEDNICKKIFGEAKFNESLLIEKIRVRWVKEGNCNSKYLYTFDHKLEEKKKCVKGIACRRGMGGGSGRVKKKAKRYFGNRFMEEEYDRPKFDGSNQNDFMLLEDFEEEEVKMAIWDCESSKCPKTFISYSWRSFGDVEGRHFVALEGIFLEMVCFLEISILLL